MPLERSGPVPALEMEMCLWCACGVLVVWCVLWSALGVVCVFLCGLRLPFVRACLEILTTLSFGALRKKKKSHCVTSVRDHRKKKKKEKKTRTMKPRSPRVVSNVS